MTIAADLTRALETAPPIPTGFRRWIIVGYSAGIALTGELVAKGRWTLPNKPGGWGAMIPPALWGISILATDQFPGWSIVDRPRSALESAVAASA